MKTALLISGNARFNSYFDIQLSNLKNSEVDVYCVLWNRTAEDDRYISPTWNPKNESEARSIIEPKLPENFNLVHIELVDPAVAPIPNKIYKEHWCNTKNLWNQYWILKLCEQRLQESKGLYDLVIRSRPDLSIDRSLNLEELKVKLDQNPNQIIISKNRYGGNFNDQFAIGTQDAIHKYCQAIDHFDRCYTEKHTLWNPEHLMSQVITDFELSWPVEDFTVGLRMHGNDQPTDFGRWI
jgi:hypothetical protein